MVGIRAGEKWSPAVHLLTAVIDWLGWLA